MKLVRSAVVVAATLVAGVAGPVAADPPHGRGTDQSCRLDLREPIVTGAQVPCDGQTVDRREIADVSRGMLRRDVEAVFGTHGTEVALSDRVMRKAYRTDTGGVLDVFYSRGFYGGPWQLMWMG